MSYMDDGITQHVYLTDDRYKEKRLKLVIGWGRNGDYYVATCPEDEKPWNAVRICTSGGAASRNPRLVRAVVELFQALGGFEKHSGCSCEQLDED
jgi:hypothetical protein